MATARSSTGPPLVRPVAAAGLVAAASCGFWQVQSDSVPIHRWNRSFADTAILLLCLILALGPASRCVPALRKRLPFRRELGVGMMAAALLHVAIYLDGVYDWNPIDFFTTSDEHTGVVELNLGSGAAANWVGLVALTYGLGLALTSNR